MSTSSSNSGPNKGIAVLVLADILHHHPHNGGAGAVQTALAALDGPHSLKYCDTLLWRYAADPRRLEILLTQDQEILDAPALRDELKEKFEAHLKKLTVEAAWAVTPVPGVH